MLNAGKAPEETGTASQAPEGLVRPPDFFVCIILGLTVISNSWFPHNEIIRIITYPIIIPISYPIIIRKD